MDLRFDGRVALVTGGSRGIGRAVAHELSASGASVVVSSRKQADLERTAAEIASATGGEVAVFAANAGDPDAPAVCVAAVLERFGRLDVLVNNAATNPYFGPTLDIDLAAYEKTLEVNLRGPLWWTKAAHAALAAGGGGAVVNISSIGGLATEPLLGVYNTTKAALVHLTRQLASELGPAVRVNAVAPGLVRTDMARVLVERAGDALARTLPLRRIGEPADIAGAVAFLASDAASWITGHTLVVDGGALVQGAVT